MSREIRQMITELTDEGLDYEIAYPTSYTSSVYRACCVERQERMERAARAATRLAA